MEMRANQFAGFPPPSEMFACAYCDRTFELQSSLVQHENAKHPDGAEEIAPTLRRYFSEPAFRAELDAETASNRSLAHAAIDAGMRRNHPHIEARPHD